MQYDFKLISEHIQKRHNFELIGNIYKCKNSALQSIKIDKVYCYIYLYICIYLYTYIYIYMTLIYPPS